MISGLFLYFIQIFIFMIEIKHFDNTFTEAVCSLIGHIQQIEFQVPITIADQPDLNDINNFYQRGFGNFWLAMHKNELVGTIALIDNGQDYGTIRKMFVKQEYRGKELGVASSLLNTLEAKAKEAKFKYLYLGTVERLQASHKFYSKNNYFQITENQLPLHYPRMLVDTMFFCKKLD